MNKYIIGTGLIIFLSGCSTHFAISGMMCDKIAADPYSTIPSECRPYSENAAAKASRSESKPLLKSDDLLIFEKDKK